MTYFAMGDEFMIGVGPWGRCDDRSVVCFERCSSEAPYLVVCEVFVAASEPSVWERSDVVSVTCEFEAVWCKSVRRSDETVESGVGCVWYLSLVVSLDGFGACVVVLTSVCVAGGVSVSAEVELAVLIVYSADVIWFPVLVSDDVGVVSGVRWLVGFGCVLVSVVVSSGDSSCDRLCPVWLECGSALSVSSVCYGAD